MKRVKALLDFFRFPVAEKIVFFKNVNEKMDNNPYFLTPDVPLADARAQVIKLEAATLEAQSGSHVAIAIMHEIEETTCSMFRKQAAYVDRIADGNEAIVISSGFHASKQPTPSSRPDFTVENSVATGTVSLSRKAVDGSKSYIWQTAKDTLPDTEDGWTSASVTTKASGEINGLTPNTKYWFRGATVKTDGISDYTNPIMIVVL